MFYLCFCYNAHVHVAENVQQRPLVYTFRWVAEFGVTTSTTDKHTLMKYCRAVLTLIKNFYFKYTLNTLPLKLNEIFKWNATVSGIPNVLSKQKLDQVIWDFLDSLVRVKIIDL